jgi:hypothetical protein
VLDEIDRRKDDVDPKVLEVSQNTSIMRLANLRQPQETRLGESITQLSQLREIPFSDEHRLRRRAGRIAVFWAAA